MNCKRIVILDVSLRRGTYTWTEEPSTESANGLTFTRASPWTEEPSTESANGLTFTRASPTREMAPNGLIIAVVRDEECYHGIWCGVLSRTVASRRFL